MKAVIERACVVSDTNPGVFRHKVAGSVAVARRAGAMKDEERVSDMKNLGQNIAWLLNRLKQD